MLDAYIYDGIRSPIGRHAGKLAGMRPDDLAGEVIAEVVKRNAVKPEDISDVILGCVTQAGEDCRNVARFATLVAGLSALQAPFKGGTLVPAPDVLLPLATDAAGALGLPFTWPQGVPAGIELYVQFWVQDASASHGLAASNALRGTAG